MLQLYFLITFAYPLKTLSKNCAGRESSQRRRSNPQKDVQSGPGLHIWWWSTSWVRDGQEATEKGCERIDALKNEITKITIKIIRDVNELRLLAEATLRRSNASKLLGLVEKKKQKHEADNTATFSRISKLCISPRTHQVGREVLRGGEICPRETRQGGRMEELA